MDRHTDRRQTIPASLIVPGFVQYIWIITNRRDPSRCRSRLMVVDDSIGLNDMLICRSVFPLIWLILLFYLPRSFGLVIELSILFVARFLQSSNAEHWSQHHYLSRRCCRLRQTTISNRYDDQTMAHSSQLVYRYCYYLQLKCLTVKRLCGPHIHIINSHLANSLIQTLCPIKMIPLNILY